MDAATDDRARQRPQELIRSIGADLTLLIRQQVALAKQEFRGIAAEKATGGGLLVGAAILGLFVIGFWVWPARRPWISCCLGGPR